MKDLFSYLFVILSVFLSGCVEPIDINPSGDRKVVVNCILTNDSTQKLLLTYSSSLGQGYYDEVQQAKITFYENDVSVGEFKKEKYSEWHLNYRPSTGSKYRIVVEIPNEPTITAETTFPYIPKIKQTKSLDENGRHFFHKDSTDTFWAFALEKSEDMFMLPVVVDPSFIMFNRIGTNYPSVDSFNQELNDIHSGTTKNYFLYLRMMPDNENNDFYLDGNLYSCVIVFRGVSPEYDKYLKTSIAKMLVYEAFNDPTQWLDESEIYSNINNGLGIFGAYLDLMFNYNAEMPDLL